MKFLDEAKIYVASGHGGAGCVSFRREKYVEFGGPNGGNGGKGGNIIFRAQGDLNTLIDFRYTQHFRADRGGNGRSDNRTGADGEDVIVKVPIGTLLYDESKENVLYDFVKDGEEITFLQGGDGGFGNARYKSSTNQAPRKSTPGWPGQEVPLWLQLKLIADIGLLGLPNAGKSTFLAAVSNAKPKVADYPFTTLHPNLGVVKAGEFSYVIADIPGLIEGASQGLGLGDRFLGHVERSAALLHLVDCTADDIVKNYKTIRNELKQYGNKIQDKQEIVAVTKSDALGDELAQEQAHELSKAIDKPVHVISSVSGSNTKPLLFALAEIVKERKQTEL